MIAPDSIDGLRVHLEQFIKARFGNETSNDVIRKAVLSDPALATLSRPDLEAALEQVLTARQRTRLLVDWGELPQVGRQARPLFKTFIGRFEGLGFSSRFSSGGSTSSAYQDFLRAARQGRPIKILVGRVDKRGISRFSSGGSTSSASL